MTAPRTVTVLAADVRVVVDDLARHFSPCCKCPRTWTKYVPSEATSNRRGVRMVYCDEHAPAKAVDSDYADVSRTIERLRVSAR